MGVAVYVVEGNGDSIWSRKMADFTYLVMYGNF